MCLVESPSSPATLALVEKWNLPVEDQKWYKCILKTILHLSSLVKNLLIPHHYELCREKTGYLQMRKQRRRSASQ